MMPASAPLHPAAAPVHPATAAAVTSAAASAANMNEETVVQPRGGGPRSVYLDGFGLRRREAKQCCDRDPSADRSKPSHGVSPVPAR
jgi:hypothetical protein